LRFILLLFGFVVEPVRGHQFALGNNYAVLPGTTNQVDVSLNNATGVASIALKINYDPSLLEWVGVTNMTASLGAQFSMVSHGEDGTAGIVMTRQEAIGSGSGVVATLLFKVNPGAIPGMTCELPVVRHEIGGQYGVAMNVDATDTNSAGILWVVASMSADSDGDGMPDWWEVRHFSGLTNATPEADDDSDGLSNAKEYRCRTNPNDNADCLRIKQLVADQQGGHGFVIRWASVPEVEYSVDRSTNLMTGFEGLASNIVTESFEGSYTDQNVTVESTYFYRVLVK
jgi:hypothetical protein